MRLRYMTLAGLVLLAQACGDSTSSPTPSRLVVTPSSFTLDAVGATLQFSARLEDKKGKEITGAAISWTTTNPEIASVDPSGLVTALRPGSSAVQASAEGITGRATVSVDPAPNQMGKVAGDLQFGTLRQILPTQPTVEVLDSNGNPIQGKFVTFSVIVGGGIATPGQVQTGVDGRASTVWQLGCSNENPQRLEAKIGSLTVSFTASVDLEALAICQESVPEGRETLPYSATLVAAGGDQGSITWSALGGLPPGLQLQPGGQLTGIPNLAGTYPFQVRVQDGQGASATADFQLRICDAPAQLAVGGRMSLAPSGPEGCGLFLPAGQDGDRYRVGAVYTRSDTVSTDVPTVTVNLRREVGGAVASQTLVSTPISPFNPGKPDLVDQSLPGLEEALRTARATEVFHNRIRVAEQELLRRLGPAARPLPDTRVLTRSSGPALASPDKVAFTNSADFSSCTVSETRRAIKVKENDLMVIYQDSIQRASDALTDTHAQWMLDHYAANGAQVIDGYFGGVSDINGDGKVVVLISPVFEGEQYQNTVAFVWSGDFFPKTSQPGWSGCPASNQMEMMRFNLAIIKRLAQGDFQALGTVVHETKHISSLYKSIIRSDYHSPYYQPLWVEEGTAEFAEEVASRIAWAGTNGPAVGAMAKASDVIPSQGGSGFTPENYSVILVNAGTTGYLSSQPNGVVTTPQGAGSNHSVYGSGWHFHRWLGDAYGNAAVPFGDSSFFRTLNDSLTVTGPAGILGLTGAGSWAGLLEEYLGAIMLNGTGAPLGPRDFTSYDFPSMNTTFNYTGKPSGDYPWPVNITPIQNSAPFATATNMGPIGPSGVRILDLTSNGTGLGLDIRVTTGAASSPFRIVVVRVK